MIDLNKNTPEIQEFLNSSINRFQEEYQAPNSIGIYCCPWSGWMTSNFNINRSIAETEYNCPDFEFVEFDFLALPKWESEYEAEIPEYQIDGSIIQHDHELGDDHLNQLIFDYLKPIVTELKNHHNANFLLQILDSTRSEVI